MSRTACGRPAIGPDHSPPASLNEVNDTNTPARHLDAWNKAFACLQDAISNNERVIESQNRQLKDLHHAFAKMRGDTGAVRQQVEDNTNELRAASKVSSIFRDSRSLDVLNEKVHKAIVRTDGLDAMYAQIKDLTDRVRRLEGRAYPLSPDGPTPVSVTSADPSIGRPRASSLKQMLHIPSPRSRLYTTSSTADLGPTSSATPTVLSSLPSIEAITGIASWQSRRTPPRGDDTPHEGSLGRERLPSTDTMSRKSDDDRLYSKRQRLEPLTTASAAATNGLSHAHALPDTSDLSRYRQRRLDSRELDYEGSFLPQSHKDDCDVPLARTSHRQAIGTSNFNVYRSRDSRNSPGWTPATLASIHSYTQHQQSADASQRRSSHTESVRYIQHERLGYVTSNTGKRSRTKPVRNTEGVLIRKDGRPDMRSISSAMNLRKVHAKKEARRSSMRHDDNVLSARPERNDEEQAAELVSPASSVDDDRQEESAHHTSFDEPPRANNGPSQNGHMTPPHKPDHSDGRTEELRRPFQSRSDADRTEHEHEHENEHEHEHERDRASIASDGPASIPRYMPATHKRSYDEMDNEHDMNDTHRSRADSVREASARLVENVGGT